MATPSTDPNNFLFEALNPEDAIAFFRRKGFKIGFDWRDVWQDEHARAFTVAKAMEVDLLQDLRTMVDKAIADGIAFEDFRDNLEPILRARGWWGRQEMVDPLTGKKRLVQLGSYRRLEIIYDTNLRISYAAGVWNQIQRTKDLLPYLGYVDPDPNPRPEHLDWSGTILKADDDWWGTHMPPNGFNCKCYVDSLGDKDLEQRGWQQNAIAPGGGSYTYVNPRTGEVSELPVGVDPGFAHNPGKAGIQYAAEQALKEKLETADQDIADAVAQVKAPASPWDQQWQDAAKRIQRDRRQAEYLSQQAGTDMIAATAERIEKLTPKEFDTYTTYTRNPRAKFNIPARAGTLRQRHVVLTQALAALPKFEGVAWRGMKTDDPAALIAAWQAAGVVLDPAFASASLAEAVARRFAGAGGVLLRIKSKTGVYMAPLTTIERLRKEEEVLFRMSTTFRIIAATPPSSNESHWIVDVEEE